MVEYQKKESSGVAKAALATAIGVGGLGLINGNFLGLPLSAANGPASAVAINAAAQGGYVTEKEMGLNREISAQGATIARLEAEKYTDSHIAAALGPVYGEISKQKDEICDLKASMAMETERRACGDERLLTYVNGNFIKAEKALNSRDINYHGCKPVIEPVTCCCNGE